MRGLEMGKENRVSLIVVVVVVVVVVEGGSYDRVFNANTCNKTVSTHFRYQSNESLQSTAISNVANP
jgi:hypothetical protein